MILRSPAVQFTHQITWCWNWQALRTRMEELSYPVRPLIQLLQNLASGNPKLVYVGEEEKAPVLKVPQNSAEVPQI